MNDYYDGTKLLSLKDLDSETPEIFLCTSNRTGGKTTYFNRLCLNRFIKNKSKFMLLYRFKYELDGCAEQFYKDIGSLFFPGHEFKSECRKKGIYHELFFDKMPCGYAVPINAADSIKKLSHLFSDTNLMYFDEFQSETNNYCPNEVEKFQSIHTSVARGQGKMVRYLPVIMVSNPVTIINPYYVQMGISHRLNEKTHFLKGHGFVLEQGYNRAAAEAQKKSGFNKAFSNSDYLAYSAEAVYLNDNKAFIEKPKGKSYYIATIKYKNINFAVREFPEEGIIYCDDRADMTFPKKISVTTEDHNINYVMLKRNDIIIDTMRYYFEHGCFRFHDLRCKEAIMTAISY